MTTRELRLLLGAATVALSACAAHGMGSYQDEFALSGCTMVTTGKNPYFVLEPGYHLVFEGGDTRMELTVLDETKKVDGVLTRVVEEREWKNGKLHEVSKNYFAMCEQTKDVFYFGEDVDYYENDKVVNHEGSWLAGVNGNRPGLIMPGTPKLNMRYYQELAPGVAMDRAEIVSLTETCTTPAGIFRNCMKVKEGSGLKFWESEYKYHAAGVGLVRDEDLQLVRYGFKKDK